MPWKPKKPTFGNTLDNSFKNQGISELEWIASMYPQFQGLLENAWSMMSNPELAIDRFSNRAFQTAARAGQGNANAARWNGLGSGSQMSFINQANQDASGQIGNFADYQYSPEGTMGRLQGLQGLLNPFMTNHFYDLSGKRQNLGSMIEANKPKKSTYWQDLIGSAAELAGGGAFGDPMKWFKRGHQGTFPSGTGSDNAGSGGVGQTQAAPHLNFNWTNQGWGF